jgi:exosortase family protein XrtF
MWNELKSNSKLKKAGLFVVKFLALYFGLNLLYYGWVRLAFPETIFFTDLAAYQTVFFLELLGEPVTSLVDNLYPKIYILQGSEYILSVYEGCNGVSLFIIFSSFIIGYFKLDWKLTVFFLFGLLIINISNVLRIAGLYYISIYFPQQVYFYHKYLFTGILFIIVISLWYWAINKYHDSRR